jgi:hypothetical protein
MYQIVPRLANLFAFHARVATLHVRQVARMPRHLAVRLSPLDGFLGVVLGLVTLSYVEYRWHLTTPLWPYGAIGVVVLALLLPLFRSAIQIMLRVPTLLVFSWNWLVYWLLASPGKLLGLSSDGIQRLGLFLTLLGIATQFISPVLDLLGVTIK